MGYISSNNINVFPSAKRGSYQRSARLLTEESFVSLINSLLDKNSFVITDSFTEITDELKFNINGYLFDGCTVSDIITASGATSSSTTIYANITVDTVNTFKELVGQDTGGASSVYQGVRFSTTQESSSSSSSQQIYSLLLLQKVNGSWTIPSSSMLKYDATRVYGSISFNVDGGEIS